MELEQMIENQIRVSKGNLHELNHLSKNREYDDNIYNNGMITGLKKALELIKKVKELEKIRTCYICGNKDQTRNMLPVNAHSQYDPPSDHSPFICGSEECGNRNYEAQCGRS
jgi:hypothetical protein